MNSLLQFLQPGMICVPELPRPATPFAHTRQPRGLLRQQQQQRRRTRSSISHQLITLSCSCYSSQPADDWTQQPWANYTALRGKPKAGVHYWPNFFPPEDFERIMKACRPIAKRARPEKNSLAKGRMGAYLGETNEAAAAVLSQDVCKRLGRKLQMPVLLPGDFPVELRMYPKGSYMDWHVDEVMYREPQLEVILTLENTSDSETQWKAENGKVTSKWAEPNSLIVVQAGGPLHQVTRINKGSRTILKFVLTPDLERNEIFEENLGRDTY